MRVFLKSLAGYSVAAVAPQCRFETSIFVVAHMRCGSTALSNILCSRPDISGYGEAHIHYNGTAALGRLLVNQALRRGWSPRAEHLFDKVLHSRHDGSACAGYFTAKAIFVARDPFPAIRSIRKLYAGLGRTEYGTDGEAAGYYIERMQTMASHWDRFAPARRVGLTHAEIMANPDAALGRVSLMLGVTPPLENHYVSQAASMKGGAGDPTASGKFNRIQTRADVGQPGDDGADLRLEQTTRDAVQEVYAQYCERVARA